MASNNENLRAAEFVVTLNGDNHEAILKVLKQFRRIVKKERRISLALEEEGYEDGDSSDDDDDMDSSTVPDTNVPPKKKYKKSEEWKADTASYHVPFVGTAVARGEQAQFVKGEWPTGLLKAYLDSSPLALELLNDDLAPDGQIHRTLLKKKKTKLSRAICKAHTLAIAELLTVAIPKYKLQEISLTESGDQAEGMDIPAVSFMKSFTKSHLPRLFNILNEETDRGRGKTGEVGGCDLLVAPALKVLKHFTMISTSNARLVARYLDESLLDGVLRICLRPLHKNKQASQNDSNNRNNQSKPARTEAILLTIRLLNANDAAVNTYICTGGSKERKVKPGILFIALREGLAVSQSTQESDDEDYHDAAADMLEHLRVSLFSGSKLVNPRLLFNLMARDPLQNLCRLSSHAPQLTEHRNFTRVLQSNDDESEDDTLIGLGVEARRLLFPLLSDQVISPFLPNFGVEQVARSIVRLLESSNAGLELRRFLIHCTTENPTLVEELLKLLTIPEPKNSFAFISRASFIADLLSKGPSPAFCISSVEGRRSICIRDILSILLPIKLKGQFLARALQSGNSLVRIESLKLILIILRRFRSLRFEAQSRFKWDAGFKKMLTLATFQWLPDLQVLLSLRSRFDGMSGDRSGALLSGYLYQVIEAYVTTLPSVVDRVNFDWMKLLPGKAPEFNQALPFLQVRILKCLHTIIKSSQKDLDHLVLSSKIIFEIMLSTKSNKIHTMCELILERLMSVVLVSRVSNKYTSDCICEEVSFWISGITNAALPSFFKLFREVLNNSSTHLAFLGNAWTDHNVPKIMNFSTLLAAAFSTTDDASESFALLVGQVAARCLASLRNPLPLAAVIAHAEKGKLSVTQSQSLSPLVSYARAILDYDTDGSNGRISHSTSFFTSFFHRDSAFSSIPSLISGMTSFEKTKTQEGISLMCLSPMQLMHFTKILNHTFIFAGDHANSKVCYWQILRLILPSILLKYPLPAVMERKFSSVLADVYSIQKQYPHPDFVEIDALIMSCPFSASSLFLNTRRSMLIEKLYEARNLLFMTSDERSNILRAGLLKSSFSFKSIQKIQLSLISDTRNKTSNLSLEFMNSCFRIEPGQSGEEFALENDLLETAVNGWIWVGKESIKHGKPTHRRIKSLISSMMTHSLKNETVKAACLLSLIEKHPESLVLDICLDLSNEDEYLAVTEREYLNTLLRSDSFRLVGPMLSRLEDMGPRMLNLWESGYLDDSLGILLRQVQSSSAVSKSISGLVASKASKRLIEYLSSPETLDLDEVTPLLNLMSTIFDTKSIASGDSQSVATEVTNFLTLLSSGQHRQIYGEGIKSLCSLSMCILNQLQTVGQNSDDHEKRLASELFSFLFATLPVVMKKTSSHRSTKIQSEVVLDWLICLVNEYSNHLNPNKFEPLMIQKVYRVCLKRGIAAGKDEKKVPMLSLYFLGLLMELMSKNDYHIPAVPTSRDVFDMIVSHSKFEQLFTNANDSENDASAEGEKAKQHVLRLMITCVLASTENIVITSDVWKLICASFNAGMTRTDILIRYLVSISCNESLPFMDEFHWKGCESDDREQTPSGKLDWMVDALDQARVRATVSRFPVTDSLELAISLKDVWTEQLFNENQVSFDREPIDIEQYSPSFLLPFVLKNIELGLSRIQKTLPDESQMSDEDSEQPKLTLNFSKSSIDSIQQLCEKGVVSLCLASLSSLCEKVRCYAVSILGLVLQACLSNYAIESPSWRDRPQLVMILNSVQRSLVLQMALDESESIVPRVTPVVATFLARAASVLPRPDDALYVPVNRYFLKTEANHGAFQDLKRLPAFMSLFCSSSEDPNQSRAERMWGLQMLCDGLADASCYKLVTSCHAPELILSSFENVRLSKASDEAKGAEICLLLGSLTSMIEHGEYGAHIHLIRRCGLLSWMSSVCSTRSIATAFPTERSRTSFCQLGNIVVEKVFCTPQLRSSELIDEVCSLIQPMVSLSLIKGESREHSREVYQACFKTLTTIANGLRQLREDNILCPDILPLGVTIESSLDIQKIADDSMKADLLRTFCSLPFSLVGNPQQDIGQELIILMIDYFNDVSADDQGLCSTGTDPDQELIAILLQRIFLLIEQCDIILPSSKKSMRSEIVTKIFALRCNKKFSDVTVRKLWLQSLKLLTQKVHTGGLEIMSLEETIRREICC